MINDRIASAVLDIQIEAKVAAAIETAARAGKNIEHMSKADIQREISDHVVASMTENEIKATADKGLHIFVRICIGAKIAAAVWDDGVGADPKKSDLISIGRKLRIAPDDILPCWRQWQEDSPNFTEEEAAVFPELNRFAPLFLGLEERITVGQAAAIKAACGDKLAQSFFAWKEIE